MTQKAVAVVGFSLLVTYGSTTGVSAMPQSTHSLEEIAYRPVGKLIYLPVSINGEAPQWFCLDSGAPSSIIDRAAARRAAIAAQRRGTVEGAGKGEVEADFAAPVTLGIRKLKAVVEPRIVDLGRVPLAASPEGLVGAEFFKRYVIRIDTDRHRIAFFRSKDVSPLRPALLQSRSN